MGVWKLDIQKHIIIGLIIKIEKEAYFMCILTISSWVTDEISGHTLSIGCNEDVGTNLTVEASDHLNQLRVEQGRCSLEVSCALTVPASHGQLCRHASQWPCSRHQHPACSNIIQPLHARASTTIFKHTYLYVHANYHKNVYMGLH